MFKPELEVPSLELCKKLKELGYPQNIGGWYWILPENKNEWLLCYCIKYDKSEDGIWSFWYYDLDEKLKYVYVWKSQERFIKAPTVRELGEFFPSEVTCFRDFKRGFLCEYENRRENVAQSFWEDTEANARAKMLIWLVENGYVRFENERMHKNFKKS